MSSTVHGVICAHSAEFVLVLGSLCLAGINDIWEWQLCVTTKAKQPGFIAGVVMECYCSLKLIVSFSIPGSMELLGCHTEITLCT